MIPNDNIDGWSRQLADLDARGLRRTLRTIDSAQGAYVTVAGRRLCCLCSNNYLGLADHPAIKEAVKTCVDRWGWGAGASRLVCGHMGPHAELEVRLAAFKHTEAALVCSTGYQANLAAIRALAGEGDVILLDKLDHGSIIDAARGSGATVRVFPHRDYDRLDALFARTGSARHRIVVTDSLFSMDGDFADLPRLVELKRRHDAMLIVDEAHATGVFGSGGRGVAEMMGVEDAIDVTIGTLSKALGGIGGFIAGSREIVDWIVNVAGPFIYTTAIPPAACAAGIAALDLIEHEPRRREALVEHAAGLRAALVERGWDIGPSVSQIIPLMIGSTAAAIRLAQGLLADGFLIPAIRPPTVPAGKARLRVSLCADHKTADLERLLTCLDRLKPSPFAGNTPTPAG